MSVEQQKSAVWEERICAVLGVTMAAVAACFMAYFVLSWVIEDAVLPLVAKAEKTNQLIMRDIEALRKGRGD